MLNGCCPMWVSNIRHEPGGTDAADLVGLRFDEPQVAIGPLAIPEGELARAGIETSVISPRYDKSEKGRCLHN